MMQKKKSGIFKMNFKECTFLIYGKDNCPHCVRAKEFAKQKGLKFIYKKLGEDFTKEELVLKCSPVIPKTVPRIFYECGVDTVYVGTADEFIAFINTELGE